LITHIEDPIKFIGVVHANQQNNMVENMIQLGIQEYFGEIEELK